MGGLKKSVSPSGKKKAISRAALWGESLPCAAFIVPFVPKRARTLLGAVSFALVVSVGPISALHAAMAFSFCSMRAKIGPLEKCYVRRGAMPKKPRHEVQQIRKELFFLVLGVEKIDLLDVEGGLYLLDDCEP